MIAIRPQRYRSSGRFARRLAVTDVDGKGALTFVDAERTTGDGTEGGVLLNPAIARVQETGSMNHILRRSAAATNGSRDDLSWVMNHPPPSEGGAFFITMTLLDQNPHPLAAFAAVALATRPPGTMKALILPALQQHLSSSFAAWACSPTWAQACFGEKHGSLFAHTVARISGDLTDEDRRNAIKIVLNHGGRTASGFVWTWLTDEQRSDAVNRLMQGAAAPYDAATAVARFIGAIGPAWEGTDPSLRSSLIGAVANMPIAVEKVAPAWKSMDSSERTTIVNAMLKWKSLLSPAKALDAIGSEARKNLPPAEKRKLDEAVKEADPWMFLRFRIEDDGWNGLTDEEQIGALREITIDSARAAEFVRAVGVKGWKELKEEQRMQVIQAMRQRPEDVFSCPPPLWKDLNVAATSAPCPLEAALHWRADADLSNLSPEHALTVLAFAPWDDADETKKTERMKRITEIWNRMTPESRLALASSNPSVGVAVAAAARQTQNNEAEQHLRNVITTIAANAGQHASHLAVNESAAMIRNASWQRGSR